MKGTFSLNDGDTTFVVPYERISFVKIKPNGNYRSVEFHIGGESIMMDKVSPSDVEKITDMLSK